MEARLSGQSLNFALSVIGKVIDSDIPLPQLALIKASCFIGYAQIQGTDLETYLTVQVPAGTLEAGAVCVSAKRFLELAKAGGGRVKLFTKNGNLVVQSGGVKGETFLIPVGEFPTFPSPTYQSTLPTKLLLSAIEKVEFAVFMSEVPFEDRIKLPYSGLEALKELLEREEKETVRVGRNEEFVFLAGTDWEMAFRVKYYGHPDYKAIIPKDFETRVKLDR